MEIIEKNTDGSDATDVILRTLDSRGHLSGSQGIRLPHGTEVSLHEKPRYLISRGHVYIKVRFRGTEGYIASDYLDAKIDIE